MGIRERWRGFKPLARETRARLDLLSRLFQETGVLLVYVFGSFPTMKKRRTLTWPFCPAMAAWVT